MDTNTSLLLLLLTLVFMVSSSLAAPQLFQPSVQFRPEVNLFFSTNADEDDDDDDDDIERVEEMLHRLGLPPVDTLTADNSVIRSGCPLGSQPCGATCCALLLAPLTRRQQCPPGLRSLGNACV